MWQHKSPNSGIGAGTGADKREYVNVVADYSIDGTVRPVSIRFDDGPAYTVARVISVIHMSSTKHNGAETRYCVRIGDREHTLFFEDARQAQAPRWFVVVATPTDSYCKLRSESVGMDAEARELAQGCAIERKGT